MIHAINPATEQRIASYDLHTPAQVGQKLANAAKAQKNWALKPVEERASLLLSLATVLRRNSAAYALLITREMGKPITEAEAEIEKSAVTCEFYARTAPVFLADTPVASNASDSRVVFDPLGVVLAIMPWNYPFWQFIRFAAPALAAGNGALLKHANNVPGCALALEQAFQEAGTPDGLVATLLIEASDVAAVLADERIAAVTLTGSTSVGKLVAAQAGQLMKKQVLELGGSDPFVVLADADIPAAAKAAVKARFSNTGQSCISSKRFIVDASVADQFVAAFCEAATTLKTGNPEDRDTTIGPMARANLRDDIHAQVEKSLQEGARLLLGGKPVAGLGYFYEPTVLDHVTPDMTAATEETFGPVAAIIRAADTEDAIRIANATEFGLGAALWTSDLSAAETLVRRIEAGAVFVNGMVASDARLPFGGIKQSGYGRELGEFGIREFTNIKTLWIGPAR
ncbi:NAD-dependent succinate-semialdehyde dehydrogenase [Paracandidimonas soli]|uniref:Succinate-semialdehyde dehydrogenase/glutarate-semialdehyde dehydrogenase n=1 Tax=Paracandidimonas soli TaxID=1917182 RepID=A0A4R3USN3_9BURK|nr:NAD-dependent succinate-semialdehyde dehydrogenase [Paracandidimonas soli]TCU93901.1 succinate-semialdehyde dehydrogenase/glutarate-semialdehyde dehydrogenase [Paracandidimonas soli]